METALNMYLLMRDAKSDYLIKFDFQSASEEKFFSWNLIDSKLKFSSSRLRSVSLYTYGHNSAEAAATQKTHLKERRFKVRRVVRERVFDGSLLAQWLSEKFTLECILSHFVCLSLYVALFSSRSLLELLRFSLFYFTSSASAFEFIVSLSLS